ncbi:MAG: hypothetical protein JXB15_05360 [Anaerolineales bacterium]|nr:hypothetical protein [Anaerolineales bacterium]
MAKGKLITGGMIILVISILLIGFYSLIPEIDEFTISSFAQQPDLSEGIALGVAIYSLVVLFLTVFCAIRSYKWFEKLSQKMTVEAEIPGHFVIALLPILCGYSLIVFGQAQFGIWIACLSLPAIFLFLVIELRKSRKE